MSQSNFIRNAGISAHGADVCSASLPRSGLVQWTLCRCRHNVHKTANVLNKLPKSQHSKAKRALQEIWMAETKKDALTAFDAFVETRRVKYDKAVECLIKDREALLAALSYRKGASHDSSSTTDD